MSSEKTPWIEVARLQVGMYIHLDLGWSEHPFTFSSFRIKQPEQLATLRQLGLKQVRWSPNKSSADPLPAAAAEPAREEMPKPAASSGAAPAAPALAPAIDSRRALLERQRSSLAAVEQRYGQASGQFRQLQAQLRSAPAEALAAGEALASALAGEVSGDREVTIRLLSERAGEDTSLHALNVSVLALLLGRACGLGPGTLREMVLGALLHDVGKLELPGRLRWSSSQLSSSERKLLQTHVELGVGLGRQLGLSPLALDVIAQHHEHADGSGYPQQLRGLAISPAARVVALCNRYDNLCNPGNALQALTPHEALASIFKKERERFDGPTLALFVRMLGVYPPGSVLQLSDGRYALSVAVNPLQPKLPRVLVYDARVPADQASVIDLQQESDLTIEKALKPSALPRAVFDYLSPRQRQAFYFEPT